MTTLMAKLPPKQLLDNLTTAVILVNHQLLVQYLNPAAEDLLALSANRLLGQPLPPTFTDEPKTQPAFQQAIEAGRPFSMREISLKAPNLDILVDYKVTPILQRFRKPQLLMEIQRIDQLRKISRDEAVLQHQQTVRDLVRGVAHELKNPLGGIRGAAQLLEREFNDDHSELKDYTQVIIREADRLRNIADRMLGPRGLPKLQDTNIHQCLEHVRSLLLAETDTISIQRDYDLSLPELQADPDQLIQCLLNIVRNAVQAIQENPEQAQGIIILKTRIMRQVTIGPRTHRLCIQVQVIDNGPGIPNELLKTIFYPMISGRANGSGLGLSISQSIINQYHGLIECHSKPGDTRFSLLLPLAPKLQPPHSDNLQPTVDSSEVNS